MSGRRKFFIEARRRGWVVALSVVLVLLVSWVVSLAIPSNPSAEAILVVRAAGPLSEQPSSSTKLAATYGTLIPLDSKIENAVEKALPGGGEWSISTTNDPNTALIRLNFSAESSSAAIDGARIVAHAVSGSHPVTKNITPNSLAIARLPTSASGSALLTQLLVVAAILGVLLGLVILSFWRPRDKRIDTLKELRHQLDCPCFELSIGTRSGFPPLFDAIGDNKANTMAVVPSRARDGSVANALCRVLASAFGAGTVVQAAVPGSLQAGELAAANSDLTILVVTPGVRAVEVAEAVEILSRYRAAPAYAVLAASGRGDAATAKKAVDEPADDVPAASTG